MFSEQAAPTAQGLLAPPSAEPSTFARAPVSTYTDCTEPFRLGQRSFSRQYAHIYATRLIQMRPMLEERAQHKWGESASPLSRPLGSDPCPGSLRVCLCRRPVCQASRGTCHEP